VVVDEGGPSRLCGHPPCDTHRTDLLDAVPRPNPTTNKAYGEWRAWVGG